MPLSIDAWAHYNSLYSYSHSARYEGIMDTQTFEALKQADHQFALQNIDYLRKYVKGKGLPI